MAETREPGGAGPARPPEAPSRRAFGGADAFTAVLDREIRRAGLPGFNSHLLLSLDRRPDVEALRRALAADTTFARWLRAPLVRRLPFGARWRDAARPGPPPRVDELEAPPQGDAPWPVLMDARLDVAAGENLRITAFPVPGSGGGFRLSVVFSHLLCDAKAAERLVARLDAGAEEAVWSDPRSLIGDMRFGEIARTARDQATALEREAASGVARVGGASPGGASPGGARGSAEGCGAACAALDESESKAAVASGRRAAGYAMEGLWYLACLLAADRDLAAAPPRPGSAYVVPVPTNLDRKGEAARTFGNNLVFLFLAVPAEEAHDPVATARRLRERVLGQLREKADRAAQAQLEFLRPAPLALHAWMAKRSLDGTLGSVFFTNPGPVAPSLVRCFGAEVLDVEHHPVPAPDPGLCAAVWSHRDRLRLGATWVRGRFADPAARALLARWRERVLEVAP